ncbi:MAG TPA: branched-chain amino acid ABC transporter permease [Gaiellaceae bacterium]|nr:branched-chain amino acid ABC transporter permease [Gaiellaceae bacterium]
MPLAAVSLVVVLTDLFASDVFTRIIVQMTINLILVVGLYIFVGNSGLVSFGHLGFVAIGAYTTGLLTIAPDFKAFNLQPPGFLERIQLPFWQAAPIAVAVAACVALVVGAPIVRLNAFACGIALLAFLIIVRVVSVNWSNMTGGLASMSGVPTDVTPLRALLGVGIAMAVAFVFQESRIGRRLRASREDEHAAAAIGVHVNRERLIAFVVSAGVVALGGAFFAHFVGIFSPDDFYLRTTFLILAMLVVGGRESLAGAVVGTLAITLVSEGLLRLENGLDVGGLSIKPPSGTQETGLGVFLLVALVLRPNGIMAGREFWPRRVRPPAQDAPENRPAAAAAPS